MNNLISKSTVLTEEKYRNIIAIETNNLLYMLLILTFFLTVFAITYYISKKYIDFISWVISIFVSILSMLLFLLFIISLVWIFIFKTTNEPGKTIIQEPVPITEIKDYIKIENNRLTINPLPENYQYQNKTFDKPKDKTKSHDFKIDDVYKESNVKLIDINNNTYEITHEQLEELKRGKNNENN